MTLHFIYMLPCKTEESSIKVYCYEGNLHFLRCRTRFKPISKLHINNNVCLLEQIFTLGFCNHCITVFLLRVPKFPLYHALER